MKLELTTTTHLLHFITATVVSALLTPAVRLFALRTNKLVQRPRAASIKTHVGPTPVGGGLAIYLAALGALWLTRPWSAVEQRVLLAGAVLVIFGILDDSRNLSIPTRLGELLSRHLLEEGALSTLTKFWAQFLAAYLLILAPGLGEKPPALQVFANPMINQILAVLWIVGIINAVNFLDIMDGLAAGVSAIAAIGFLILASFLDQGPAPSVLALVLAGSALGFLFYNFEPASIFMGDAGSQFLGLVLGTLALMAAASPASGVIIIPPLVLLGIPLFEITFTMIIRTLTGKLPWKGSKDHFPLRMFKLGFSVRKIVVATYSAGLLLTPCALWLAWTDSLGRLITLFMLAVLGIGVGIWLSQVEVPKPSLVKE